MTHEKEKMEDLLADTEMYFKQIIALLDLIDFISMPEHEANILTLRELAGSGLAKAEKMSEFLTQS